MEKTDATSILIVEDESIVALDIQHHLKRFGYRVLGPAASAAAAFNIVEEEIPDLVLMDIKIQGDMDGVETAGIIREEYHRPVIMLTAYADEQTLNRAKLSGPFGYILKPFDERELRTTIEMALYRHKMELKLKESEERYRRLFEEDLSGDFIADGDGIIIDCNPAFLRLCGFKSREEIFGSSVEELFSQEHQRRYLWDQIKINGMIRLQEFEINSRNNGVATVLANMVGNFNERRELQSLHGYLIDTTEMKNLEHQLRQAQKMEAIGRMAGGIAHDFNNLLTVILGYITLVNEKYAQEEPLENELEGIRTAAGKAAKLTRQLLAFSRQQVLNPEVVNVNDLMQDLEKMIRRLIDEDIAINIFPDASSPKIYVDPSQLEQVVLNLVVNARDAMGRGGKLTIETRNIEIEEARTTPLGQIPQGSYCVMEIEDNGKGIPDENLPLIFEPFFTTKPAEKGTGLGLSTVYGIVKQSKGYIDVESALDQGTAFRLYFPITEKSVQHEPIEIPDLELYLGTERILLVEDDNAVRAVTLRILNRAGYDVIEARNAGEALLIFEESHDSIDLVLTDFVMPHLTGDQLIERLQQIRPEFPSIIMSGYMKRLNTELAHVDAVLAKPFRPEELLRYVRSVLDGNARQD